MQTKTVSMDGVSFTVHTETGLDVIRKAALLRKIYDPAAGPDDTEFTQWFEFINAYVQSSDVTTPFAWPAYTTDIDVLLPLRDAFFQLSGRVYVTWKQALEEVDTVPGSDPELLPVEEVDPKFLATNESQPNGTQPAQSLISNSPTRKTRAKTLQVSQNA